MLSEHYKRLKQIALLAIVLLECACSSLPKDESSSQQFSFNPIMKKEHRLPDAEDSSQYRYELDGLMGTATIKLPE